MKGLANSQVPDSDNKVLFKDIDRPNQTKLFNEFSVLYRYQSICDDNVVTQNRILGQTSLPGTLTPPHTTPQSDVIEFNLSPRMNGKWNGIDVIHRLV